MISRIGMSAKRGKGSTHMIGIGRGDMSVAHGSQQLPNQCAVAVAQHAVRAGEVSFVQPCEVETEWVLCCRIRSVRRPPSKGVNPILQKAARGIKHAL